MIWFILEMLLLVFCNVIVVAVILAILEIRQRKIDRREQNKKRFGGFCK